MNTKMQSVRVGLFFILGLALIWVVFESLSNKKLFGNAGYTVVARFNSLKQLKVGDDVRMAGVKIGSVSSTRLHNRMAEADLTIDPTVKVSADAVARISMAGLLGNNYVSLSMGTADAGYLKGGDIIQTGKSPDINDIMAQLGSLGDKLEGLMGNVNKSLSGLTGSGKNQGLFGRLNKLVAENSDNLKVTIANLRDITTKISQGQGTIGKLVNDPKVYDNLSQAVAQIKDAAAQANKLTSDATDIMNQIKSGKGTIGTLVYNDKVGKQLEQTVANIKAISDKLNSGQGTLGKLINDDGLYNDARTMINKADRTLDGLSDSGPISAVGVAAKSLF